MRYAHLWITRCRNITLRLRHAHVIHMLDTSGTLRREPFRGSTRARKGAARGVAFAIGTALFMSIAPASSGSIDATKVIRALADYQLTEYQESCHNQIVYRESRWDPRAVNGSHHGLYQGKSQSLKNASPVKQWWWYWYYVAHRYGWTDKDEPNYCKALHHLKTKGWQ
jgi:hypothetical protein